VTTAMTTRDPASFVQQPKGTEIDEYKAALKETLRPLSETERLAFVTEILTGQHREGFASPVTIAVARQELNVRTSFRDLLKLGISFADASNIHLWLEAFGSRLGVRRTLEVIHQCRSTYPVGVSKLWYWLGNFPKTEAEKKLVAEFARRYPRSSLKLPQ